MTTVSLTSADVVSAAEQGVAGEDVRGITELARRVVKATYRRHPKTPRALSVVLVVLTLTCLVAVGTRWSALPLMPLPLFAIAAFALAKMRAKAEDGRQLLIWTSLFAAATLFGFWLMSVAARWLEIASNS